MITSKQIREEIKKKTGLTSREVSVRQDRGCIDWSFTVQAKTERAMFYAPMLFEICDRFRKVDYCEASGAVLMGGNTYVFFTNPNGCLVSRAVTNC